ncbi:MAG: DUF4337 domain-containing protein [Hyphomicrobiaceae bacterium]
MSGGHGHGHGHAETDNKKIAILISILALLLAIAETAGKSAQTDAIKYNVEASNLWAFFQAKTIRMTTLRTAAETLELDEALAKDPEIKKIITKRIERWKDAAKRYDSEPETQEGRKELARRAKESDKKHKTALARYHHYEIASASFQIAIVLASAYVITTMVQLLWIALGLGGVGLVFSAIGAFAPHAFHLF